MRDIETVGKAVEHIETIPPDGEYAGTWGGYVVKFNVDGRQFRISTRDGIRTLAAPVRVNVLSGKIRVLQA